MTFDDEAIEAAAKLEFDDWVGLSEFDRKHFMATMKAALIAAISSMKARGFHIVVIPEGYSSMRVEIDKPSDSTSSPLVYVLDGWGFREDEG